MRYYGNVRVVSSLTKAEHSTMTSTIINVGYDETNYYLIGATDGFLMLDVGWPGTLAKLLAQLKRQAIALTTIRYLLVTHYHPDHAGLVQELKAHGVQLVVIEQQRAAIPILKTYIKPQYQYQEITFDQTIVLRVEATRQWLASIGIAGEIILTPGHSDDSVSLILDNGIAFIGDLHPYASYTEDPALIEQSWQELQKRGVTLVYPGHGGCRPLF